MQHCDVVTGGVAEKQSSTGRVARCAQASLRGFGDWTGSGASATCAPRTREGVPLLQCMMLHQAHVYCQQKPYCTDRLVVLYVPHSLCATAVRCTRFAMRCLHASAHQAALMSYRVQPGWCCYALVHVQLTGQSSGMPSICSGLSKMYVSVNRVCISC